MANEISGSQLRSPYSPAHSRNGAASESTSGENSPSAESSEVRLSSMEGGQGLENYGLASRRAGEKVICSEGQWWREVRPCFFRPILPFLSLCALSRLPERAAFGGCQYPSDATGEPPNSCLAYILFKDAEHYNLDCLSGRPKTYVRSAEKSFHVGPIVDRNLVKDQGHTVYVEFHRRTSYGYLGNRVSKPRFDQWVDAQFGDPGLIALGAWSGRTLVAVSLSRIVGDCWVYSSFFASDAAARAQVANLMIHHVRTLAAAGASVKSVFVGMSKAGTPAATVDEFYLRRGASVVRRPSVLRINPIARWLLPHLRPALWYRINGQMTHQRT